MFVNPNYFYIFIFQFIVYLFYSYFFLSSYLGFLFLIFLISEFVLLFWVLDLDKVLINSIHSVGVLLLAILLFKLLNNVFYGWPVILQVSGYEIFICVVILEIIFFILY